MSYIARMDVDMPANDLLHRIAQARANITGGLGAPVPPEESLTVAPLYDPSYWMSDGQWLPPRAEMDVQINCSFAAQDEWRRIEISLASGPEDTYRYFPFTVFVYQDNVLSAVAEFSRAHEVQVLPILVAVNRKVRVTIISELSDVPAKRGLGDDRELAVLLLKAECVTVAEAPGASSEAQREANNDWYTKQLIPLVPHLPRPIFVIGAYRSGTSILTWAIGQHPNIWPLDETGWLHLLGGGARAGYQVAASASRNYFDTCAVTFDEYMAHIGSSIDDFMKKTSLRRAGRVNLRRLAGKALDYDGSFQLVRSMFCPKDRWVDGTPENAGAISLLRQLFPLAKFIAIVRNPLDVVASMAHFSRAGGESLTAHDACNMWLDKMSSVLLAYQAYGPSIVHLQRYEDILRDPSKQLEQMFRFLGEPQFPKAAQTYGRRINSSTITEDERAQTIAGIAPVDRSRMDATYASLIDAMSRPWVESAAALTELMAIQNDFSGRLIRVATQ